MTDEHTLDCIRRWVGEKYWRSSLRIRRDSQLRNAHPMKVDLWWREYLALQGEPEH